MTNLDIQAEVSGLIPKIQQTQIDLMKLNTLYLEAKQELEQSDLYKAVNWFRIMIEEKENEEKILRENGKDLMIQNWLHDFTTLDWVTVQLNKTPGSLKIDDNFECPEEYFRIKKEIDKAKLKKDYNDWKFYDDNISIDVEYKLVIKQK